MSSPSVSNWQYGSPENELCLKGGSEKRSRISLASCCKDFSVLTQIRNDIQMAAFQNVFKRVDCGEYSAHRTGSPVCGPSRARYLIRIFFAEFSSRSMMS